VLVFTSVTDLIIEWGKYSSKRQVPILLRFLLVSENLGTPKCVVQFRTGSTEALLSHYEHRERALPPCSPVPCQGSTDTLPVYCFGGGGGGRGVINPNHFGVNKARYPPLGGMDSLSSLLTATVLRRNQAEDNMTIWREGSPWRLWEWHTQCHLRSEVGSWKLSQTVSF